jgi:hypothetical protein
MGRLSAAELKKIFRRARSSAVLFVSLFFARDLVYEDRLPLVTDARASNRSQDLLLFRGAIDL